MDLAPPLDPALLRSAARPPVPARTVDPEEARRAAEAFEAFFLSQVMEQMFTGLDPDPLFGGGPAEQIYRSMLFQEYGAVIARGGGVGIGDLVQKEILKLQEVQP